jgi:hypothetical protein
VILAWKYAHQYPEVKPMKGRYTRTPVRFGERGLTAVDAENVYKNSQREGPYHRGIKVVSAYSEQGQKRRLYVTNGSHVECEIEGNTRCDDRRGPTLGTIGITRLKYSSGLVDWVVRMAKCILETALPFRWEVSWRSV